MRYTISSALTSLLIAPAALAEVPLVVTDIPPVQSLVAQVMGDLGAPELLLDRGADAHSFQLRPSQARSLANAGLVVWIGPEMTPWLDRTLESSGGTAAQLRLAAVDGLHRQAFGAHEAHDHGDPAVGEADHDAQDHEGHDHDHDAHAEDDAAETEGHEGHSHSGLDPHLWLDPANAGLWLTAIAAELGRLDPENAPTYAANAEAAAVQVGTLDAEVAALLQPVKDRPFVVFHDAYGYFSSHYGLTVAGEVALGDASAPGAARLTALREDLAAEAAVCIFPEVQHDPKLVAQLAEGTGVRIGGALDPEGALLEPGAGMYAALMTGLATTIAECLGQP